MSTRKLIAAALLAGLAILVAGGIQLVLLAREDGRTEREVAELGTVAVVDGIAVAARSARVDGGVLVLGVAFDPGASAGGDAARTVAELARGWALFEPDADLVERAELPADAEPCPSQPLAEAAGGAEVRCDVAFAVGSDPRRGTYLANFQGAQAWRVPLPLI